MKRILILILLLQCLSVAAQHELSRGRQSSVYTYVYKIPDEEVYPVKKKFTYGTPVDSFINVKDFTPPPGNYLLVKANKGQLIKERKYVTNINLEVISTRTSLMIVLYNKDGEEVKEVPVWIDKRSMTYDAAMHAYTLPKYKRQQGDVRVKYQGVLNVFKIYPKNENTYREPGNNRYYEKDEYKPGTTPYENKYRGYLTFSKPTYKPGDTVRLKAFLIDRKGRPVTEDLRLRLTNRYQEPDTLLTVLHPYRPGGFEYQFVMGDSIELDNDYMISLESMKGTTRKYDDEDDHIYRDRKILFRKEFKYEEYELTGISLHVSLNKKIHQRNEPVQISLSATDDNDLPVLDGRVQISIIPNDRVTPTIFPIFIPDTLWQQTVTLEPVGATIVPVPDSIFPAADFKYYVHCELLNSENKRITETDYGHYTDEIKRTSIQSKGDSIYFNRLVAGKSIPDTGTLIMKAGDLSVTKTMFLQLPAVLPIEPYIGNYSMHGTNYNYFGEQVISYNNYRNKDSVFIHSINPHQIPFWYTIYAGKKMVASGYGKEMNWEQPAVTSRNYTVQVQYILGNRLQEKTENIIYAPNQLALDIHAPKRIAPGQEANIQIAVTDIDGKPVADADLTAYSMTRKLNNYFPDVPYMGKQYPLLKLPTGFYHYGLKSPDHPLPLDYPFWKTKMRLDTILWYQFSHPTPLFRYDEPATDGITQIAPFVMTAGQNLPVHIVYIDHVPVYVDYGVQLPTYSFRTTPGKHLVELRTSQHLISFDSITVHAGVKNFISIDPFKRITGVKVEKRKARLTNNEAKTLNQSMVVLRNSFQSFPTFVSQGDQLMLVGPNSGRAWSNIIAGPFRPDSMTFTVYNQFSQTILPKINHSFLLAPQLMQVDSIASPFSKKSELSRSNSLLTDEVMTFAKMQAYFEKGEEYNLKTGTKRNGQLNRTKLSIVHLKEKSLSYIVFFKYDDTTFVAAESRTSTIYGMAPGMYQVMYLYSKNSFIIQDSILVKDKGTVYYQFPEKPLLPASQLSAHQQQLLNSISLKQQDDGYFMTGEKILHDNKSTTRTIAGVVLGNNEGPLPGVSVMLEGTKTGTITNANGFFALPVTERGELGAYFIGFEPNKTPLTTDKFYIINMEASKNAFQETVVAGYDFVNKPINKNGDDFNISKALEGRAASVTIIDVNSKFRAKKITVKADSIADNIATVDANDVITENNQEPSTVSRNSIRKNFRDDAFWQPKLRTDANGIASFKATFPDDITTWRVMAIAMNDHQQSGYGYLQMQSFIPLSGNLALPNFAVTGDSIAIIGKALNYTDDTVTVSRQFAINDSVIHQQRGALIHAVIDTFDIAIPDRDSMQFKYSIHGDNYMDGEERSIPVFPRGVKAHTGFFAAMVSDTAFNYMPDKNSPVKVYAEAALLPVLMEEIKHVERYKYLCNEQLASKLKAYLLEQKVTQSSVHKKDIKNIISRLNKTSTKGLWGWWENNDPSMWVSLHVLEALIMAKDEGYDVNIYEPVITKDLLFMYQSGFDGIDSLGSLLILSQLQAKVDYTGMIADIHPKNGYDSLRLLTLQQRLQMPVNMQPILARQQTSLFGNAYWGPFANTLFYNSIEQTLMVYKLLRKEGGHDALLKRIRGYFLEERRDGQWRNTYESSKILETILPDVIADEATGTPSLKINNNTVDHFPYATVLPAGKAISFDKMGGLPVYITASQEYWDPAPAAAAHAFKVTSGLTDSVLQAGKTTTLTVNVDAEADADYVQIEIPIPAGCSYADKSQSWYGNEVHREYEKQQVSIFCKRLNRGMHTFTVQLMPRYTGFYHLNPARVELQYFPLFMGRTGMKKVHIR